MGDFLVKPGNGKLVITLNVKPLAVTRFWHAADDDLMVPGIVIEVICI